MPPRHLLRGSGAVRLCNLDPAGGMLTVECKPCNRRGRYRLETLIEAQGPRAGLPDILRLLAARGGCRSSVNEPRTCHARFTRIVKRRE